VRNAPVRRPECEAVIEGIRIVVLELFCPRYAAVLGLVDAKIRWVPRSSNRHQVGNGGAESLHIAELQHFGAWNYTSSQGVFSPSVVTVKVPARPDAQTTSGFTGQTAIRPLVVPLFCGVSVG